MPIYRCVTAALLGGLWLPCPFPIGRALREVPLRVVRRSSASQGRSLCPPCLVLSLSGGRLVAAPTGYLGLRRAVGADCSSVSRVKSFPQRGKVPQCSHWGGGYARRAFFPALRESGGMRASRPTRMRSPFCHPELWRRISPPARGHAIRRPRQIPPGAVEILRRRSLLRMTAWDARHDAHPRP